MLCGSITANKSKPGNRPEKGFGISRLPLWEYKGDACWYVAFPVTRI